MHLTIRLPLIANTLVACFALSQAGAQESQSQKLLDKYRRIDAAMMQNPPRKTGSCGEAVTISAATARSIL